MSQTATATVIDITDDGFIPVRMNGITVEIDVYQTWNHLLEIGTQHEDKPVEEYHAAIVGHLDSLGFPGPISHRAACQFREKLWSHIESLQKKDGAGPTPGSPTTSEPTHSDSPAETSSPSS